MTYFIYCLLFLLQKILTGHFINSLEKTAFEHRKENVFENNFFNFEKRICNGHRIHPKKYLTTLSLQYGLD